MTTEIFATLDRLRFVPVVEIDDGASGGTLARALTAGGVPCAEITLRTAGALEAIAGAAAVPGFLVGAGTVLSRDQLESVVDAGASFVVSPGYDEELVERGRELGIAVIPGVSTASEVQRAARLGLSRLKFFPAEAMGGVATLKAFAGPFPAVSFMPSGGVSAANALEYLALPNVFAVSGSWIASREAIATGDWAAIEQAGRSAMRSVNEAP
jgi:2-dehydro-3-deoxyphosphogluconate aldolase/(4S)-4-hydroxy-2-oxoglutarate aldolase